MESLLFGRRCAILSSRHRRIYTVHHLRHPGIASYCDSAFFLVSLFSYCCKYIPSLITYAMHAPKGSIVHDPTHTTTHTIMLLPFLPLPSLLIVPLSSTLPFTHSLTLPLTLLLIYHLLKILLNQPFPLSVSLTKHL